MAKRARWAVLVGLAVAACGGAPPPDLHEGFRRIQRQEALIAHRLPEAHACAAQAPCPARDDVCDAADEVCAIAAELDDADAHARCGLARRRCAVEGP